MFPSDEKGRKFDIPTRTLMIPRDIILNGQRLVWGHHDPERDKQLRVRPTVRPLQQFLKLAEAPGEAILTFAKTFGPLNICSAHGLPVTHSIHGYAGADR